MAKELWEIKYRPTSIEDYLFQDEQHREKVQKFIEEQSIPHLLLNGHRGTGKTSLAVVLKNELGIADEDFLLLNASDENNVDTIRNKIKDFISLYAMSPFKMVVLDEADYLSHSAQAILRHMMEEEADNARFILSSNIGHKIIPELKSRCHTITFKRLSKDSMLERLAVILKSEKVKCKLDVLNAHVDAAYPDMRKAVQSIQNSTINSVLQMPSEVDSTTEVSIRVVEAMEKNNYAGIREILSGNMGDDDWEELYKFLYTYLQDIGKFSDEKKWKAGIIILADHLYRHSLVSDPEINAVAMFIRLGEI